MTRRASSGLGGFAAVLGLGLCVAAAVPFTLNGNLLFLAGLTCINIIFALAYNLLFSYAGLMSFGQAMFFATGAYLGGLLSIQMPGLPFPLVILASAASGTLLALVVGILSLRRSEGIYFAVLTLGFSQLLYVVITHMSLLGRNDGLTSVPRPVVVLPGLGMSASSDRAFYAIILITCAILCTVLWWVEHSRLGRSFRAIRLDPARAGFLGIDVHRHRLAAFAISGAVTAAAAALYGPWTQIVTPDVAYWGQSTLPLLCTLLGGAGLFWGPAIGAMVFAVLQYATRNVYGASDLITGALLLLVILGVPGGLGRIVAHTGRLMTSRT